MKAIEITDLAKSYRVKRGHQIEALQGVTFDVSPGEVFGFVGPNGAGKSTTIKCLVGLVRQTRGNVHINGHDNRTTAARACFGYLPENPALIEHLTSDEYLSLVIKAFSVTGSDASRRIEDTLAVVGLADHRKKLIRTYSKGMVQRLALAQTLVHDPDIYIMDEPMSGLDPIGRALVKEIIRDLKRKGKTVFFSTHITADVEVVCDRVGIIVNGRLEAVDSVDAIMQKGIKGYDVQVRGIAPDSPLAQRYGLHATSSLACEGYVPQDEFNSFMEGINSARAQVELIETRRRDLESFFLDIVSRSGP